MAAFFVGIKSQHNAFHPIAVIDVQFVIRGDGLVESECCALGTVYLAGLYLAGRGPLYSGLLDVVSHLHFYGRGGQCGLKCAGPYREISGQRVVAHLANLGIKHGFSLASHIVVVGQ